MLKLLSENTDRAIFLRILLSVAPHNKQSMYMAYHTPQSDTIDLT